MTPEVVQRIAEVSAAATAAGINPWLAALTLVGLSYLGWVDLGPLPGIGSELGDPVILIAVAAAFLVEQIVDKVPALDHASDLIHLPIKPAAAAALAMAVAGPGTPSSLEDAAIPLAVAAAVVALIAHLGKAGVRAVSSATTGGLANPLLSVAEDLGVVGLIVAAVLVPALALLLVALIVVFAVRAILRWVRRPREASTGATSTGAGA